MSDVRDQYEAYPYPERDPADEKKRLITGSPSHPLEIDHFVFGGQRDWSVPLRALIAGGGTGDALIQLAQVLTSAGRAYDITYIDLSKASRRVAEARAKVRGLKGITFVTGSLLDAADYGPFDYIDCCGVLHHLPEPQAGFDALAAALEPGGGLGFMVYAPYGRSGVYPLQEAFGLLFDEQPPKARLKQAQAVFAAIPDSHPFKCNPHLVDHKQGEAGFYDLLLHSQDQAFSVRRVIDSVTEAGLQFTGFSLPALYDPADLLPEGLAPPTDPTAVMEVAEKLRGTIKVHIGYATRPEAAGRAKATPHQVPHLKGTDPQALARHVAARGRISLTLGVERVEKTIPKEAAALIRAVNGKRSLGEIAAGAGLDPIVFGSRWGSVERVLEGFGLLNYSGLLRPRTGPIRVARPF